MDESNYSISINKKSHLVIVIKFLIIYSYITILPVVLYGCETCSLTLREKFRLRVFENRILRRIFGLHNEKLHSLYHLPNIARVIKSRRLRWAGHVTRMEEVEVLSKF